MRINALWLSASVLTLGWCGAAAAQTTPDSNASATSSGDEEIVVTAERRTQNLQTTPLSATVLSGEDLANRGVNTV
ncbi:MAG: hypothetical protein JSS00_02560, partial [Proteobacteria bacterium]|nr:hypothetical protein [Pseudomonadota bacterium]